MFRFAKPAGAHSNCPLHLSSCSLSLFYVTLALPSHILSYNLSSNTLPSILFMCSRSHSEVCKCDGGW